MSVYKRESSGNSKETPGTPADSCAVLTNHPYKLRPTDTQTAMRISVLFFFMFLGLLTLTLTQGTYEDCCLRYVTSLNLHRQRNVVSYRNQLLDGSCNILAIVFKMKNGRVFCANPRDKWVQRLVAKVDKAGSENRRKGSRS